MELSGNTILITGGSGGIGLALAKKFVALGNNVIVTGRNPKKLDAAKKEEPKLSTIVCDAADVSALERLAKEIDEEHPDLNVLINNAGIMHFKNLTAPSADLGGLTQEVDVNVSGPIRTVSALIHRIKANKGTIINVSSGLAFVPLYSSPIYCATKAFVHSYTVSLRQQLEDVGVEVVELMPPAVKTDMTADIPEGGDFKIFTTDQLVDATIAGLKAGKQEIRPGQANQLHWMSRIAPGFINAQLKKGSAGLLPPPEDG